VHEAKGTTGDDKAVGEGEGRRERTHLGWVGFDRQLGARRVEEEDEEG
jgi:hypothetical protein